MSTGQQRQRFERMNELEPTLWWFRAKRRIVLDMTRRFLVSDGRPRFLDLGIGAGSTLARLERIGEAVGMDISEYALDYASKRTTARLMKGHIPEDLDNLEGRFDCVLMLDLLEHLDNDFGTLLRVRGLLAPDGILVITVPAYQWLFAPRDVYLGHKRRYTRAAIRSLLERAGFEPELISYYNTFLFPLAVVQRLVSRAGRQEPALDLVLPPRLLNHALERVFASERFILPHVSLPFGLSVISVSRARAA